MADCLSETSTHNAIEFSRNSTLIVYRCRHQFYLASGNLVRMCRNGTWTGSEPSCLVDSVLPKQLLVLLIVGVTVTLFALCIPLDFYRFRKRKRECREKQQRINMMVRIQPFHAKMMGIQGSSTEEEDPPPSRSFGLGSLLAFFRLVRNKRNRTKKTTPAETPTDEEIKINTPSSTNTQSVLNPKEEPSLSKPPLQPILETNQKNTTSTDSTATSTDRFGNEIPNFPRAKSLGSGVGKLPSTPVTPRSATFTDSRSYMAEQRKTNVSVKANNSSKGDHSHQANVSDVERGDDIVGVERSNSRHLATRPSKSLVFNNRYTVTTRDSDSAISPCCLSETSTHNAIEFSRNSTLIVYRCRHQFYLASGNLVRMCRNGTWTGSEPSCLVDSVLPKQLLVLLIVGVTVTLFALCIPLDFYRFRKRKRECREKQQRINMMVRIQPFHAKMMGIQGSSTEEEDPPPSRSFGLGSLLAFFRLVRNKRNRTKKTTPSETPTDEEIKINTPSSTNTQSVLNPKEEPSLSKPPLQPILETNQKNTTSTDSTATSTDRFGNEIPNFPRAKSLGSGVGKLPSTPVTPRSATFTDSRSYMAEQRKTNVSVKANNSSKGDHSHQANVSDVERGNDIVGVERSNSRHLATRPSKSLVFNNRYTVTTRDSDSAISPCKPLPSVGSSPSHSPLCEVNMGF